VRKLAGFPNRLIVVFNEKYQKAMIFFLDSGENPK
jgi:hypothetical protein